MVITGLMEFTKPPGLDAGVKFIQVWVGRCNYIWIKYLIKRDKFIHLFWQSILAMALCWLLSYILTVTGRFPDDPNEIGYLARTDAKVDAITKMDWFYFPYPGN